MGKHIVISCEGGDFSMDLIYAGLVRRFGRENVIDYPSRKKFRQGKPVLTGDPEADYGAERRSLSYVEDSFSIEWDPGVVRRDIKKGNIDFIWLDETDWAFSVLDSLLSVSHPGLRREIVVVAGHDSFRGQPETVLGKCSQFTKTTMFIDDWKPEYDEMENTHLINLSCNFDHLWDVENRDRYFKNKVYDICFIGYNSNPVRKTIIDHVEERWGHLNNCIIFEERPNEFSQFVRHREMFRLMAQSKICLNLPGASASGRALRYYEIPYVGSFMLTMETPTVHISPKMGVSFNSLESLDTGITTALKNESWREAEAELDHQICMKYHTVDARMNYIFEVLDGQK